MRRLLLLCSFSLFASSVSASDLRHVEDAALRSVHFLDDKEGWAVGDEGVILHTLDGGKSWQRQPTGVRASLRSVYFLNPTVGWVAGREELPYGMGAVGVVLFTSDGGLEWKKQLANTLPGMNQVRFVDAKTGYLLGDGTDQFPSGIFQTTDSGRNWEPVPGPRTTSWLAGDFYDGKTGILVGASSRLATLRNGKCTIAEHADSLSGRDITALQILGNKTLAVAHGGLILTSVSGGSAWDFAKTKLPTEVLANLDLHAVHSVKDKIWIAGRPGSVILHSNDSGTTWSLLKTGQSLPLHGIYFFNEKVGWAVGDAGTILHTSDGGKSWKIQHQGGQRAAALCIHSTNKTAPVDTLAHIGGAEGYLTTSLRITANEADARRYANAMRLAGTLTGESLWHFPMPQHLEGCDKKTIVAHWNDQLHKGRAEEELIRQLVLTLRTWRPSVVIGEHPHSKVGLSSLVGEAIEEAVRRAADAKAFPEQIEELGLQAWQVRKVYGVSDSRTGALVQDNDEPQHRLEMSARDYAAAAHALLTERFTQLPRERYHHRLGHNGDTVDRSWMEGIEQKVGESRREFKIEEKLDAKLREILLHRKTAVALAENTSDPARLLAMIPLALEKLPEEHAAPAAFAIASRLAERGQWYLAQEAYLFMVDRYPAHPLSVEAYRWLIHLNTSREARRRHDLKHFALADPLWLAKKEESKILRVGNEEPAPGSKLLTSRPETRDWNRGSQELIKRLAAYGPVYGFDSHAQFCVQSAKRQLGESGASHEWMMRYRKFVAAGPWHEAATAEAWLSDRSQPAPRKLARSRYTEVRPFLDGKFDDPCWKDHKPSVLEGDSTKEHATETMFAFDQEFLYIALKCTHPIGKQVAPVKARPRDADVDAFDRVSILLDLDRDYSTYYQLEVDQRGCVRDSCWGDRSWNPKWFVAVHSTEISWQIEAAIPLAELTGEPIREGAAWAFNAVRIMPGRGVQSWSQPADMQPRPEGMSLLLFQTGKARPMPMP